jgi:hypothetical protein
MEMRRHPHFAELAPNGRMRARCDRGVVFAYWLLSGYGLKASKAIAWLVALIVVAAVGLRLWGFTPEAPWERAGLFALESTSGLVRMVNAPGYALTYIGEVIQFALRILGPLLLGLTFIALRARVKR